MNRTPRPTPSAVVATGDGESGGTGDGALAAVVERLSSEFAATVERADVDPFLH